MIGEGQDPGSADSALGDVVCAASDLLAQGRLPLVFALTSDVIPRVQPIRPGKRGQTALSDTGLPRDGAPDGEPV